MARIALVAVVVIVVAGCGGGASGVASPHRCTDVGCVSGVFVVRRSMANVASMTLCVHGRCRVARADPRGTWMFGLPHLHSTRPLAVSLTYRDRRGRITARASGRGRPTRTQPNGPDCPPVCFQLAVALVGGQLRFGARAVR